jgi:hypothetical protein
MCSESFGDINKLVKTHLENQASKNNSSILRATIGTLEACLFKTTFHAMIFGIAFLKT